ncbi:hypothetical protein BOTNAR_0043g00060 [Botryotinia narcissicola]|uniref:Uncharacterized protein n=1 Tax=Botryotinia narcissicola TaxID=278944 RepID=A0A4Z1J125_9HELO|nr:hypothetical protein BOTNAR_0043g00060 [Botryotinia narcissicola]
MDLSIEAARAKYHKEGEKEPMVQKIDWHTEPEYSSVFVGDYDINDILHFVELLYTTPEIQRQLAPECCIKSELTSRIHYMIKGFLAFEYEDAQNLGKLLATFRGKGSTIPADQVYSLFGLTVEGNAVHESSWFEPSRARNRVVRFPEIDYKQSIRKLCTDTTKYVLTQDGDLNALQMINTHAKPVNDRQWPSWVPDFTSPLPGLGEPKSSYWGPPPADISRTNLPREKKIIHIENDKLLIYGHVLSEIRKPFGIVENNGRRDKALEREKRPIGERQLPFFELEFLPMSIWEDSEGREVHGTLDVKKRDLVVMVARSKSPLILRRLKGAQRGK